MSIGYGSKAATALINNTTIYNRLFRFIVRPMGILLNARSLETTDEICIVKIGTKCQTKADGISSWSNIVGRLV